MEKINRNVLETKADLRLADKIDEIVRRINELEGGQEVRGAKKWIKELVEEE